LESIEDFDFIEIEQEIVTESGEHTDLDLVGYKEDKAVLFELKPSFNKLYRGFNQLEKGMSYLSDEHGYQVEPRILIMDDSLLSFREVVEDLPSVYGEERLFQAWSQETGKVYCAMGAGICHDIDNLTEEVVEPSKIPKYDWKQLEDMDWVEETEEGYTGTEVLENRVNTNGKILHTTGRANHLIHPTDYI
jgi:hypothetical protein